MAENIDAASFASILAGVRQMREEYDTRPPSENQANQNQANQNHTSQNQANRPNQTNQNQTNHTNQNQAQIIQPGQANRISPGLHPSIHQPNHLRERQTSRQSLPLPRGTPGHSTRQTLRPPPLAAAIQVAPSQKGNPLLDSLQMKLTPWAYSSDILSDYYISATVQVLFLSLKYHRLRPEYVWRRIEKLKGSLVGQKDDTLRVLLVVVDIDAPQESLRHLLGICVKHDLALVVAWSFEEAGTYVACLKQHEQTRSHVGSSLQGVRKGDYNLSVVGALTTVRAVNRTDVAGLLAHCRSFKEIVLRSAVGGVSVPGIGERKQQTLHDAFTEPFVWNKE